LAPLVSDGPIIILVILALSQVPDWLQRFLHLAGGLYVLYLAYGAAVAWRRFDLRDFRTTASGPRTVVSAAIVNILNPSPYIYWSLVTGPILLAGWRETPANGLGFLASFYVTIVLSLSAIVVVFGMAGKAAPKVNRALLGASWVALLCFGLYQLWLGATGR
jgi:threonine/homoserine/homoserine lactone efflux protein